MNVFAKLTVLILFNVSVTSCFHGFTGVVGNRNVISEDRALNTKFEQIQVQQGINVVLSQGDSKTIHVEADENIMELLVTEVVENELRIYFKKNVSKAKEKNVYLTVQNISKISTSSGARVQCKDELSSQSLELDSSRGSSMHLQIKATSIKTESSSGSSINLTGLTKSFEGKASSGSSIDADKLQSMDAFVKASSGANIHISVTGHLNAKASSGGGIDFSGSPKQITKEASSGGHISGS